MYNALSKEGALFKGGHYSRGGGHYSKKYGMHIISKQFKLMFCNMSSFWKDLYFSNKHAPFELDRFLNNLYLTTMYLLSTRISLWQENPNFIQKLRGIFCHS